MVRRRVFATAVVAAAATALAGCSGGGGADGNRELAAVVAKARHVAVTESFRLRATIRRKDTTIDLVADFGAGGLGNHAAPARGVADVDGVRIAFIRVGGHLWLRGPAGYWRSVAANLGTTIPARLVPTLASRWVRIADNGAVYGQLEPLTDKGAILGVGLPMGAETAGFRRVRTATVDGRAATVWAQSALHRSLAFARSTGALLEIRAPGGSVTLSGYGTVPTPRPPAHSLAGSVFGA